MRSAKKLALVAAFFVSGCGGGGEEGTAHVSTRLMEDPELRWIPPGDAAPAREATAVNVTVEAIEARRAGGDWESLAWEPREVDLVALRNGTATLLGDAEVPAGRYTQVRLLLADDATIVFGRDKAPLYVPSARETGVKLNGDLEVRENVHYELQLAVDLDRSLHFAKDQWVLTPAISGRLVPKTFGREAPFGAIRGGLSP